jgi:monolysocardiolipin acyltransferase
MVLHEEPRLEVLRRWRPGQRPLVTVSNHPSCLDDPFLWAGLLSPAQYCSPERLRWTLAAEDICFKNVPVSLYFALGKGIPTVRGVGVYQRAVDFAIERLNRGEWIHVFSEGKVNTSDTLLRLKWGVGRMVDEARTTPLVVPLCVRGMQDVQPLGTLLPRPGKRVAMLAGEPLDLSALVADQRRNPALSDVDRRKALTDAIQERLGAVYQELLHREGVHCT